MSRNLTITLFCAVLIVTNCEEGAFARGFGGGGGRGGGGFRGGGGGGFHGGYGGARAGGMAPYSRTPSFSAPNRVGSTSYRGAANTAHGSRSGSYTTQRGSTINYGVAGAGAKGPHGGAAGRAIGGVQVTTPGGRTATQAGRAGGVVGPYGNAMGGRSSVGVASGPRGTVAGRSQSATAIGQRGAVQASERGAVGAGQSGAFATGGRNVAGVGQGGAFRAGERGTVGVGQGGAFRTGERGAVGVGPGGAFATGARGVAGVGPGGAFRAGERGAVGVSQGEAFAARGFGVSAARPYGYNTFGGYHAGWVHGHWTGHGGWGWNQSNWAAWGLGVATGVGLGWGLTAWGSGSALYNMGYMPYANPYYESPVAVVDQPAMSVAYDYSQPIDTMSAPPSEAEVGPALTTFDSARDAFKQGDYTLALKLASDALAAAPNDTALHEFRGLCLFALGRFDEAAASIYAVLSVGPGWDWTTLISLYSGPAPYTTQLRALEDYCKSNPNAAAPRFVLAYHYLTAGHTDAAATTYKKVVKLMPSDTLSAKLLRQLEPPTEQPASASAPSISPAPTTAETYPPAGSTIEGTWTAKPTPDTSIRLSLQPGGPFTWEATQKGKVQSFTGTSTYKDGLLSLTQDKGPVLVGRVSWVDPNHMTFRIDGDGPDAPGLSFTK